VIREPDKPVTRRKNKYMERRMIRARQRARPLTGSQKSASSHCAFGKAAAAIRRTILSISSG